MRIRNGEIDLTFEHVLMLLARHRTLPAKPSKTLDEIRAFDGSKSHGDFA